MGTATEPSAVRDAYPNVRLRVLTGYSGHLRQWLDAGDLALLYDLRPTSSFSVQHVVHEQLWAVAPPDAGLRVDEPVPLALVAGLPLILPERGHGLRVLIERAFAQIDVSPEAVVETNSMRIQKQLVLSGHGWTILPAIGVAPDVAAGQLSGAPLRNPAVRRTVALVSRVRRTDRTCPGGRRPADRVHQAHDRLGRQAFAAGW